MLSPSFPGNGVSVPWPRRQARRSHQEGLPHATAMVSCVHQSAQLRNTAQLREPQTPQASLALLQPGSLRARCRQVGSCCDLSPWAVAGRHPLRRHGVAPPCVAVLIISSSEGTSRTDLESALETSLSIITSLKAPSLNTVTLCDSGGSDLGMWVSGTRCSL